MKVMRMFILTFKYVRLLSLDSIPPKRNDLGEGSTSKMSVWTAAMNTALVDAFLNQYDMGLKVNDTFISKAYDNIIEELVKNFNVKIEKSQLKS